MFLTDIIANKIMNASVLSNIKEESSVTEIALSIENKKRKIEDVYSSGQWKDEYEYEVLKSRQVIRNHIFEHFKFIKGEGAKIIVYVGKRKNYKTLVYGK